MPVAVPLSNAPPAAAPSSVMSRLRPPQQQPQIEVRFI
jgi:hypothetical protein